MDVVGEEWEQIPYYVESVTSGVIGDVWGLEICEECKTLYVQSV